MIRLALLLLGADFIRSRWGVLAVVGLIWAALGVLVFIDALDGAVWFPVHLFGYLLILEALVTLVATTSNLGTRTVLRKTRGVVFLVVGLLIIDPHRASDFILAITFGLIFLVNGGLRVSAAWVVRFTGWRASLGVGILELLFAVFLIEPYPTWYAGTVPYCVGSAMIVTGLGVVLIALRMRRLPPDASLTLLFTRGPASSVPVLRLPAIESGGHQNAPLVVHVWTPTGSVRDALPQPLVDRYVAAVDANGTISTGHAALEMPPDLYISHYPAEEIDHSPHEFRSLLRATEDNNVKGRWQPSYAIESAGWCESTARVEFTRYNPARLRAFWEVYSQDTTYNLTNRNCSSTVACALESALEGTLGAEGPRFGRFLAALVNPELWVAAQLRKHCESMAWTPGLVLDYARALRVAMDQPPLGLVTLVSLGASLMRARRHRRALIAAARSRAAHTTAKILSAAQEGKSSVKRPEADRPQGPPHA
jgi:uncharacterized membrane protein HdeD (DUF308 family)